MRTPRAEPRHALLLALVAAAATAVLLTTGGKSAGQASLPPACAAGYPVRVAYPASFSARVLSSSEFGLLSGHRTGIAMSGVDGRGVTIALLDTGVDPAVPYLRGRVQAGIDVIGGDAGALAAAKPDDPTQIERHGTEMAGLL